MPRRRGALRRIPKGFESVRLLEQNEWAVHGPTIDENPGADSQTTVYPDWQTWAEFYGQVREEYLNSRRAPGEPACERLYQAILAGRDPDQERADIVRELYENDPRIAMGFVRPRP